MVGLAVIVSGCVNSDEKIQSSSKIINFDVEQIALNDTEIREVLGQDWQRTNYGNTYFFIYDLSGIRLNYDKEPFYAIKPIILKNNQNFFSPFDLSVFVYEDIEKAKEVYSTQINVFNELFTGNRINIGDDGISYTFHDSINNNINGVIMVLFRRNNVLTWFYLDTKKSQELNLDTAVKLAKKQDAKISRILDMIK